MKKNMPRSSETADTTGLEVNVNKTKTLQIKTKVKNLLKINNKEIEVVVKCTYLGTLITKEGRTSNELKIRKNKKPEQHSTS